LLCVLLTAADADRPLCERRSIVLQHRLSTLSSQMSALGP
jgi:hypothetical protein